MIMVLTVFLNISFTFLRFKFMQKVYKAKFWKDRIWILLIPGILGLIFLLFGLATAGGGVYSWLKGGVSFGMFIGTFLIFSFPFMIAGGVLLYMLIYGIKIKIIINDKFLILDAPLYKKKIPIQDILKIDAGEKSMPIITYSGAGPAPVSFKTSSTAIVFKKKRRVKILKLPNWRHSYYLPQIAEDLKKINPDIKIS